MSYMIKWSPTQKVFKLKFPDADTAQGWVKVRAGETNNSLLDYIVLPLDEAVVDARTTNVPLVTGFQVSQDYWVTRISAVKSLGPEYGELSP